MQANRLTLLSFILGLFFHGAVADTTGPSNAITDVVGIEVGQYTHPKGTTGVTVVLARAGAVGGVDVRGSAPGTRETDLLDPINLVEKAHAVVLSGGSAYGLASASGVMHCLEQQQIGFAVDEEHVVPIVPAAVLYDLARCGAAFDDRPTAPFGRFACQRAKSGAIQQGNVGAGAGAQTGEIKGGLGTASTDLGDGVMVGAIVAVNAYGTPYDPTTGEIYALDLELDNEFAPYFRKRPFANRQVFSTTMPKNAIAKNTTIATVATNVELTKAQAKKIAQMAHDGMARAIRPSHTMFDGDTIFALATGEIPLDSLTDNAAWGDAGASINRIGAAAANTLARAIVHAILQAESVEQCIPNYCDYFVDRCVPERNTSN